MTIIALSDIEAMIGKECGVSDWFEISQERINQFADVTLDHQFIHIDEEKAKDTPFGGTIAHGFLTLSLLPKLGEDIGIELEGVKIGVNYGFDKIRFLAPVKAGAHIRARFTLKSIAEKKAGQFLLLYGVTVDIKGHETPALIADWLSMQIL